MAVELTCREGHRWTAASLEERDSVCPVCAAPAITFSSSEPVRETPPVVSQEIEPTISHKSEFPAGFPQATEPDGRCATAQGRFTVLRLHARGGLGQVSLARDEVLRRQVALKEIRSDRAEGPDSRDRFLAEAEVTGQLEHPGIVPIYALGWRADGRPFYVMKFVQGRTMAAGIAAYHSKPDAATLRDLLRRLVAVCQAVAYAYSRGVIHRDLKPANIMLGEYGETLVLDWGLAKRLSDEPAPAEARGDPLPEGGLTLAGEVLGTPAYMSPEQASGHSREVGPATDVYALGAMLYELLTGRPPYRDKDGVSAWDQVRQGPPPLPSQVNPRAPRALEAICLKAMARRPEDRYRTATELAEEIERWLADEPVLAYREPVSVRVGRWQRRHRALVAAAAALLLTAVAALTVGIVLIGQEQAKTELAREQAESNEKSANQKALAEDRYRANRRDLYAAEMSLAFQAWEDENAARVLELLDRQRPEWGQEDLRGFEWYHLWKQCHSERLSFFAHLCTTGVAFSSDGKTMATVGGPNRIVALWDVDSARPLAVLRGHTGWIRCLAFSADGRFLATGGDSSDHAGEVRLWDVAARRELAPPLRLPHAWCVGFSPDGKTLAAGSGDVQTPGAVHLFDMPEKRVRAVLPGHIGGVSSLAFSPDGQVLVSVGRHAGSRNPWIGEIKLWDARSGGPLGTATTRGGTQIDCVAFAPDGKEFATVATDDRPQEFGREHVSLAGRQDPCVQP